MALLKLGAKAPDFSLEDTHGNVVKLSAYQGQMVVLYFYPQDNTPTCTIEACSFRDAHAAFKKNKIAVFGISPDSVKKHQNFTKKHELPFPLLTDTEHRVIKTYGVWGPKKLFGRAYHGVLRTTYIINEKGNIAFVFDKVHAETHAEDVLKAIKAL